MKKVEEINKSVKVGSINLLKRELPQVFEDGKINLDRLKEIVSGETIEKEDDRFFSIGLAKATFSD